MEIVYGLAAALSLGLTECFAGGASRCRGLWPTKAGTRAVGLLAMTVEVLFVPWLPAPASS